MNIVENRVMQEYDLVPRIDRSKGHEGISVFKGSDICHFFAKLFGQSIDIGTEEKPVSVHKLSLDLFLSRNLGENIDTRWMSKEKIQGLLEKVKSKSKKYQVLAKSSEGRLYAATAIGASRLELGNSMKWDRVFTAARDLIFSFLTRVQHATGLKFSREDMKKLFPKDSSGTEHITIQGADFEKMIKNAKESGLPRPQELPQEARSYVEAIHELRKPTVTMDEVIAGIEKKEMEKARFERPEWLNEGAPKGNLEDLYSLAVTAVGRECQSSHFSIAPENAHKLRSVVYALNCQGQVANKIKGNLHKLPLFQQYLLYEIAMSNNPAVRGGTKFELLQEFKKNYKAQLTSNSQECAELKAFFVKAKEQNKEKALVFEQLLKGLGE